MPAKSRHMRFHWSLPGSGVTNRRRGADPRNEVNPVGDLDGQRDFCRRADELGIDSLLLPIGFQRADGCVLAAAFGLATKRVNFMPRPGRGHLADPLRAADQHRVRLHERAR